jgi:hypothetical protein
VDFESQNIVRRNRSFVDGLLAFGSGNADSGHALNAEAEQQRLADQEQVRRLTGGGQITIQRDSGGFKLPGT